MIRYPYSETDPHFTYDLLETQDKSKNTDRVMRSFGIHAKRAILIGDSGGDGPHFEWGAIQGAFLIGSMTKPSLKMFCEENGIKINLFFGISYNRDEEKNLEKKRLVDFMELSSIIEDILA